MDLKKNIPLIALTLLALFSWALFLFVLEKGRVSFRFPGETGNNTDVSLPYITPTPATSSIPEISPMAEVSLPAIRPVISYGTAKVIGQSLQTFAYAHGTVAGLGKIFIGMSDVAGNSFSTNALTIFGNDADLKRPAILSLPSKGDAQTMIYDSLHERVYFALSSNGRLEVYSLNPHNYFVESIISTSTLDIGRKPAIVTDGTYIYGITNTDPASVFRVMIKTGELEVNSFGHIPNGHSAAIGSLASSTELYFAGGMTNGFEKVDPLTLSSLGSTVISPCSMSDDMPFVKSSDTSGYVYIGCETVPYGLRVKTEDLSYERFSLPGASLGLFAFGSDIYNAARDGYIDLFREGDLDSMIRYKVVSDKYSFDNRGQPIEVNEIIYTPENDKIFFTAWYGVKGLYEVATSTGA